MYNNIEDVEIIHFICASKLTDSNLPCSCASNNLKASIYVRCCNSEHLPYSYRTLALNLHYLVAYKFHTSSHKWKVCERLCKEE